MTKIKNVVDKDEIERVIREFIPHRDNQYVNPLVNAIGDLPIAMDWDEGRLREILEKVYDHKIHTIDDVIKQLKEV